MIVLAKEGQEILTDDMPAKVGRNVSDAQPAARVTVVVVKSNAWLQGQGMLAVPLKILGQNASGVVVGMKIDGADEIAMQVRRRGRQGNSLAEALEGVVDAALVLIAIGQGDMRMQVVRLQPQRLTTGLDRFVDLTHRPESIGQVVTGPSVLRRELDGPSKGGHGVVHLTDLPQGDAQSNMRLRMTGGALDRPPARGHRFVEPALAIEANSEVVAGLRKFRLEAKRFAAGRGAFVPLTNDREGLAEIALRARIAWIDLHRLAACGDGLVLVSGSPQRTAQIVICVARIGPQRDGPGQQCARHFRLACLGRQHAQAVNRVEIVRMPGQDFAVDGLSLGEPAGLMVLEGGLQGSVDEHGRQAALVGRETIQRW